MPPPAKRTKVKENLGRWRNKPEVSFDSPHPYYRELILGASDCGKTTYLKWSVRREHSHYHNVLIIGPHVMSDEHGLKDLIQELGGKVRYVYTKFDDKCQSHFYKAIDAFAAAGQATLVIVDDPIGMRVFTASINQSSRWNSLMSGTKHKKVGVKYSVQGGGGLSPLARKMCDRIVRYPDFENSASMHEWCQFMDSPAQLTRLINKYTKQYSAVVFTKFRGLKGLFKIDPNMNVSPISDFDL